MALKRWIDIDRRWNKNLHSRLSPVIDEIFCPSTEKNCIIIIIIIIFFFFFFRYYYYNININVFF